MCCSILQPDKEIWSVKRILHWNFFFFKSSTKCGVYLRINSLKVYNDIFIVRTGRGLPKYIKAKVMTT